MGARNASQRSFGLVDQLAHDVGYGMCEFFWRRAQIAEAAHAERASVAFSFLR
jgi:hypothetical protein